MPSLIGTVDVSEMNDFHYKKIILELKDTLAKKEIEIAELKKLLDSVVEDKGGAVKLTPLPEEVIADLQIKRLLETAINRNLNLEEAKQYDLFVKNKRLLKGDSTDTIEHKPLTTSKQELIKIAKLKK